MLLSFAQFEREVTGERIRDKIAASKKKGIGWVAWCRSATGSRGRLPRGIGMTGLADLPPSWNAQHAALGV